MQTAAQAVLAGLVAIVFKHLLEGGPPQAGKWLRFVFTGRDANGGPVLGSVRVTEDTQIPGTGSDPRVQTYTEDGPEGPQDIVETYDPNV